MKKCISKHLTQGKMFWSKTFWIQKVVGFENPFMDSKELKKNPIPVKPETDCFFKILAMVQLDTKSCFKIQINYFVHTDFIHNCVDTDLIISFLILT